MLIFTFFLNRRSKDVPDFRLERFEFEHQAVAYGRGLFAGDAEADSILITKDDRTIITLARPELSDPVVAQANPESQPA